MAVNDWSTNEALNGTLEGINVAEGSLPPDVNNMFRAMAAAIKAFFTSSYRKNETLFIRPTGDPAPTMVDGDILLYYTP